MFAIIDIETCGGTFKFKKGRITEICILVHDGLQVIDKFTTLINPECHISPFFIGLTGITNEMVEDAPKFHEVAKKILELTEGKIFIAHNVGFDYGFIKDEFASLGYKYKRETLCTVRLSRKLLPGRISYSLGHLCASLGIENEARHRAEGDAVATAKLFDLLLRIKGDNPQFKNQGVNEIMSRRIDKIKQYILDKIPEECGVYYFLNKTGEIIYIGKSTNMYNRALSHFNTSENKGKKMLNDLYNVDFVSTGNELIALLLENEEIKKHKPKYNRMSKADNFSHSLEWKKDEGGVIRFFISEQENTENPLLWFTTYAGARERLEQWIDEYELCLKYCELTSEESICFNHQIKTCKGICAGEEEAAEYNLRATKIVQKYLPKEKDFILIDEGRNSEEKSVVLVEAGKYIGFGYFDQSDHFHSPEELKSVVKRAIHFPDMDNIIRTWLEKKKDDYKKRKQFINLKMD